jgi:hypothetical protein
VDHRTQFLQLALNIFRKNSNIFINGRDFFHSTIHDHSYSYDLTVSDEQLFVKTITHSDWMFSPVISYLLV